jgi:hypothetical protein
MLKIKREQEERNTRQRKRPSFFQDYENEENNLDKMLDEFEQEQILEARTPREPRVKREPKNPGSRPRKRKVPEENRDQEDDKEIELETSRSGRVRKIRRRKVYAFDDPDEEEDDSGDDGDEFRPDSEPEEPDEEYLDGPSPAASDEENEDSKLPLKKRLPGEAMTKEEIEAAKRAAFAAKPQIVVDGNKYKGKDKRDEIDRIIKPGEDLGSDFSDDELSQVLKMQPKIKKEPEEEKPTTTTSEMETNAAESSGDSKVPEDVSLNTPKSNPEDADEDEKEESEAAQPRKKSTETQNTAAASNADDEATKEEGGELEGSVTEETQNWNSDDDVVDDEPLEDDDNAAQKEQPPTSSAVNFGNSDNGDTTQDTLSANNVATPFSDESRTAANNFVENGQNSLDSEHPQRRPPNDPQKITSAEEDLLSSTQATDMEEGDEQYKNMIAESQMDNLFN